MIVTIVERNLDRLQGFYLSALVLIGLAWIADLPGFFGQSLIAAEWIGPLLGIGIAAAMLHKPYFKSNRLPDALLGLIAIACWSWMAVNYSDWIIDISGNTPIKIVPAILALVLLLEGMRKAAGLPITILVWVLIGYALFGGLLPALLQAQAQSVGDLSMYLFADTNGVPGRVMIVVGTLVLGFVVLGRVMELSGAIRFFTDLSLALMGSHRGGPAKVAVLASGAFGSINGTAVGNIMSTGIVTIPLMKEAGFRARFAAAIEAVASNGGQFAPPVMGATAFLIAEFLQVSYTQVVFAALIPAVLYYVCLLLQVDAIAARFGLHGLPRSELPRVGSVFRQGWFFFLPLVLLIWLLFFLLLDPAWSALAAAAALLVLNAIRERRLPRLTTLRELLTGAGESMLPLLMIAGGAGIVIGIMNITGLGFSLSIMLSEVGENAGLLVMLLLTALLSIVLGMGMPTTAIYVVLSVVLAPALVDMGIGAMAAHLFIFYFGLLSFLTPPVAVASFVAAGLAGSNMWATAWEGMKLAAMAYLLPLLWVYNPALLLDGSAWEIALVTGTALVAAALMARGLQGGAGGQNRHRMQDTVLLPVAIFVGGSTVWFGASSPVNAIVLLAGAALLVVLRRRQAQQAGPRS